MARMTNAELLERLNALEAENAELRLSGQETAGELAGETAELRFEQDEATASLRAENAALRAELDAARAAATASADTVPITPLEADAGLPPARRGRHSRWWAVLSASLIIIGLILAPTAVVASWAKNQLASTETFVATFGPLADDPAVQNLVTDEVVAAIDENVDVAGLTNSLFDGVEELGLGPQASRALDLLRAPAVAGIQSLIQNAVQDFVRSDAFSTIWKQSLTVTHDQLLATLNDDPNAAVGIDDKGQIGVQLGPIIDQVKQVLVKQGIGFASQIPTIDKTIVVAQSDQAVYAKAAYGIAVGVGTWLPWIAIAFLIAGVLVARRRIVALLGASIGLAVVMIVLGGSLGVGRIVAIASLSPSIMTAAAAGAIYDQVITFMAASTLAVAVLAVTVAVVGWLSSSYRPAAALRAIFVGWVASVREAGDKRGVTTGRFGEWLYRMRIVIRVAIAVIGSAVILFVRPLNPSTIIWTAVIAIIALGVLELLQRPVVVVPADADGDTPVVVG
ncbi:MAG: hypothetical protein ABWX82_13780 [Leifsonia sp.]